VHPTARFFTRLVLWPVIGFAAAWLYLPWWLNLAVDLGAAAWLVRRRRRRLRTA
jgi:hypothetical protein